MIKELEKCVNELCTYCKKYEREHEGACDGCIWLPYRTGEMARKTDVMKDIVEDLIVNCECEECIRTETDEDGTEYRFANCPFVDNSGYCKIGDPSSWVL